MYGLPDLSTLTMATSGDRNKLVRQILAPSICLSRGWPTFAWRGGYPRRSQERGAPAHRGHAADGPVTGTISFDTVIELKSGNCRLSGGDDAR